LKNNCYYKTSRALKVYKTFYPGKDVCVKKAAHKKIRRNKK
jgi:hypothetical protein